MAFLPHNDSKRSSAIFSSSIGVTLVEDIWGEALDEYKRITGSDLRRWDDPLARQLDACTSNDDVLSVLEETAVAVENYRRGGPIGSAIRGALKHLVFGLSVLLETGAEAAASLAVPGGKAPFTALAVLLKAAKGVSARLDDLTKLFTQFNIYLQRLNERLRAPLEHHARAIAVEVLVEMLKAFALATKVMRENRFKHFLRALFVEGSEAHQAIQRLEDILTNEERTSITHLIVGMHALKEDLLDVRQDVKNVGQQVGSVQVAVHYTSSVVIDMREDVQATNAQLADLTATIELLARRLANSEASVLAASSSGPPAAAVDWQLVGSSLWTRIQHLLSGLNADDRTTMRRSLGLMCFLSAEMVTRASPEADTTTTALLTRPADVLTWFIPMALTFVPLFMLWKAVSRPPGCSASRLVILDVHGRRFVLDDSEIFLRWESLHRFLLLNFEGKSGIRYVEKEEYRFGNAEHRYIGPMDWSHVVKQGINLELEMSIIDRQRCRPGVWCPWCNVYRKRIYDTLKNNYLTCSSCGRTFLALTYQEDFFSPFITAQCSTEPIRFGPPRSHAWGEQVSWPCMDDFHRIIVVQFDGASWTFDEAVSTEQSVSKPTIRDDRDTNRVKVYELWGTRWIERGVGFSLSYKYHNYDPWLSLCVHSLSDYAQIILQLSTRDAARWRHYNDTLIIWEDKHGGQFAFNFRYRDACAITWRSIMATRTARWYAAQGPVFSSGP